MSAGGSKLRWCMSVRIHLCFGVLIDILGLDPMGGCIVSMLAESVEALETLSYDG
jgi:hypothetical protein